MPAPATGINSKLSKKEMSEAIKTSGYLLEQRVGPILEEEGFYVQMNAAYADPETRKSREIDISAIRAISAYKKEYNIFPMLLCECENNSQPIVFFSKESIISFLNYQEVKVSGIPIKFWDKSAKGYSHLSYFTKMKDFHHYCKGEVATQYCSFHRKKDKSSWMALHVEEQHDTLNSLIKALEYEIDRHFRNFVLAPKGEEEVNIQIYYPLLILQGDLYSASLSNNRLVLKKSNHIQFRKELFLPLKNEVETYQIDVITEKYLKDYLKLVNTETEKVKGVFKRKREEVRLSINKIIAEARKAKKKPESYREYFDLI